MASSNHCQDDFSLDWPNANFAFFLLSSLTCHMSFPSSAIINHPSPPFLSSGYHRKTKKSDIFAMQNKCSEYWFLNTCRIFLVLHLYLLDFSPSVLTSLTSNCQHLYFFALELSLAVGTFCEHAPTNSWWNLVCKIPTPSPTSSSSFFSGTQL